MNYTERPLALSDGESPPWENPQPATSWASIIHMLHRRRKIFFAVAATVMALIVIGTLLAPARYTATVKLIAGDPGDTANHPPSGVNDPNMPVLNALMIASGVESAETFAELVRETPVAQGVIDRLKLPISAQRLAGLVKVKPITNTSILAISVDWSDRVGAARIANEFAAAFVDRERDIITSQATAALAFLSGELPRAAKRLSDAQTALADFERQHGIADIDSQTKDELAILSNIDTKSAQLQVDKQQALAQIGTLERELASRTPTVAGSRNVAPNPILEQLRNQLAQVDVQLEAARAQYTDQHPTVIALKRQHADLEEEIASQPAQIVSGVSTIPNPLYQQLSQQIATLRAQAASDDAQLAVLAAQRKAQEPRLRSLPLETMRLSELKREAQSAEGVYTALQHKYDDATVAKTTAISNVTVTEPATPGNTVRWPNPLLNFAVGIVISVTLGLLAVLLFELFDDTFKDEQDAERRLGLPILASIPKFAQAGEVPALPWVAHLTVESFLQLITSMAYASDKPLQTIAITSPSQGDGKTTIAANMAIAMADLNPQVLLIDADMRRASLHTQLGIENGMGLSDVLVGATTLEEAVTKTRHPGLDCLTSGTLPPNPIKLLKSKRFEELLETAKQRYHTIVIDTPALRVFDAAIIGSVADGLAMVVAANYTEQRAAREALKRLRAAGACNFLGIVLNMISVGDRVYSDYYLGTGEAYPKLSGGQLSF